MKKTNRLSDAKLFARVLQLRADGLSFRAIEGRMPKAFNLKEAGNGFCAMRAVRAAEAAKKAAKKKTKKVAA